MTAPKTKPTTNSNRAQRRYRRPAAVLLRFEDPEMEGLEVRTRRVSLGVAFDLESMASGLDETAGLGDRSQVESFLDAFARLVLLSWNVDTDVLDDNGTETGETTEVPPTLEGLMSLDLAFVMAIFGAWMENVVGVAGPLEAKSSAGARSGVPPLPMEPLSESPGN